MAKLVPFKYSSVGEQIWQSTFVQLFAVAEKCCNAKPTSIESMKNKKKLAVPTKSYKMFSDVLKCFVR